MSAGYRVAVQALLRRAKEGLGKLVYRSRSFENARTRLTLQERSRACAYDPRVGSESDPSGDVALRLIERACEAFSGVYSMKPNDLDNLILWVWRREQFMPYRTDMINSYHVLHTFAFL